VETLHVEVLIKSGVGSLPSCLAPLLSRSCDQKAHSFWSAEHVRRDSHGLLPYPFPSLAPSPLHSNIRSFVATPPTRNRKIRPRRVNIRRRGSTLTVHHLSRSDHDRSLGFCPQFPAAWPLFPTIVMKIFQIFKRSILCYECNSESVKCLEGQSEEEDED
jgi:hypothetical protein